MYDVDAIRRIISKRGVDAAVSYLISISGNSTEEHREELTKKGLIVNGYPNISLVYSLA